jgi:hypothetical protein
LDILDWTHQWDNYEMFMYVRNDEDEKGIYMQVSERIMRDGAEEWVILYDRKLAELLTDIEGEPGTETWEENMLKTYLHRHPQLVNEEKAYVEAFLRDNPTSSDAE